MSSGDYSFDIENLGQMYCRGGTDATPLNDHVVLKLLVALVASEIVRYEPEEFHRKYAPDAVSIDGLRWFECGRNNLNKIKDIVLERKVDEIVFHRFQERKVEDLSFSSDQVGILVGKAKIRRPRIVLYLWQGRDIQSVRERLRRHSEISEVSIEEDGEVVTVSFVINGSTVSVKGRRRIWEPKEKGK